MEIKTPWSFLVRQYHNNLNSYIIMFTTGISNTDSGNITTASGSNALTNIGSVSSTGTATWGAWTGWPTYYGDGFTYWPPFMKRWDDSVWPIYDITWYYGNNYVNI
jgi:hypothetical protein